MTFGKRITMLREEKKMSRKDVAKALNISYSSMAKYETDDRFPVQETLKAIADFFQVSTDYLLGRTSVRNFYEKAEVEENDFVSEG
ncbi:MAG TPA: helix-turn-helix transcriptional regulator, partial [Clostridiales bacterium]|nr:helix-turn-helix transcriptional regulator [Clostridiales bacterium]